MFDVSLHNTNEGLKFLGCKNDAKFLQRKNIHESPVQAILTQLSVKAVLVSNESNYCNNGRPADLSFLSKGNLSVLNNRKQSLQECCSLWRSTIED